MKERLNAIILEHLNTIIIAGAILLAVVVYCFGTRYQVAGGKGAAHMVNRITGSSWYLAGPYIYPMKEGAVRNPPGPTKNPFDDLPDKSHRNDNQ